MEKINGCPGPLGNMEGLPACEPNPDFKEPEPYELSKGLFPGLETNRALVRKDTVYSNPRHGITEPQRKVIKALSGAKGNHLVERYNMKGRLGYCCRNSEWHIISHNFSRVVVRNLVSKGYLIEHGKKIYLK